MVNKLIKKNLENEPCWWWLRSADSGGSRIVGSVFGDGFVDSYDASSYYGVAAACLII